MTCELADVGAIAGLVLVGAFSVAFLAFVIGFVVWELRGPR